MDNRPIGVFDSGFGGLTVARALIDLLPNEELIYLGDTGRYPYGPRPPSQVHAFSMEITRYLVEQENVKMVVVACNTASSVALEDLSASFPVPVIGVIEPGLRAALRASRNGLVGVIGTVGTIASGAYQEKVAASRWEGDLICAACPGFVEFVEQGELDSDQVLVLTERLLAPLRHAQVDTLLLGCTHYPFLARTISDVMGREVLLVSSGEETAFDVKAMLDSSELGATKRLVSLHRFLSSGDADQFATIGRKLFGPELVEATQVNFSDPILDSESVPLDANVIKDKG